MIDILSHLTDNYQFSRTSEGLVLKIGFLNRTELDIEDDFNDLLEELKELIDIS